MEKENNKQLTHEIEALRLRLKEAEETLSAVRSGEVDAIVVSGLQGEQVFTLTGAERAYRVLIETMNEGAASLNQEGMIIYCNHRLSEMLKTPLEKIIGSPMRQFIRASDLPVFDSLIEKGSQENGKGEVAFINNDGTMLPVLLSISALQKDKANIYGITVTDLTAQKHIEDELKRHRDHLEKLVKTRTSELETSNQQLQGEITERKKSEERLKMLNECFLEFGPDQIENINRLVSLCGKFMGGTCALYNRLEKEVLCSLGQWNVPPDFNPVDAPEGHICYDVIRGDSDKVVVIRNLPETAYARTDPNVTRYNLQTYVGIAVKCSGAYVGSLCVVYQEDILPSEDDKNMMGIIASAIGVEEKRRQADETLRESQQLIEGIINAIPVRVFWKDKNLVYLGCNAAFARDAGFADPKDIIAKDDYQMGWSDQAELYRNDDRQVIENGVTKYLIEEPQTTPEGNTITLLTSKLPLRNSKGEISGVLGTYIDITERKRADDALRASEERFRQIAESTEEWIWEVNSDGLYTYASHVVEKILGYNPDEIVGKKHFYDFYPSDKREQMKKEAFEFFATKRMLVKYLNSNVHKNGNIILIETSGAPILDSRGDLLGYRGVDVDITEYRKLEDQLRHAQKMEAVGTLAGGIAHDFNNILNVIIGYGTMLLDSMEADSLSKEQMNEVLMAAERAANLTKGLLVFSRKQVVEVKPVNINETILGIQTMLVRMIRENIDFKLNLTDMPLVVMADAGQIEQVLMNLATNAKDAMPEGGHLTIVTGLQELDNEYVEAYGYGKPGIYALITVTDTGHGMDAETQQKIFEPFFTTKGIGEGTGLGLAISYGIIKQHNGYIKVYSEPGQGAEFKIYLPLVEETAELDKKTEAAVSVKGGNETILVAEDDPSLRKLSRIVLESFGYGVITAEDGEDAITKFIEHRDKIALVVLDMIMPKKSGKEASEEIKKTSPGIKTLFMSGYTMDFIKTGELTEAGFDFIYKPFVPQDFLKKVREVLDR